MLLRTNWQIYIADKKISRGKLAKMANIALATASVACSGNRVGISTAEKISEALDVPLKSLFDINKALTTGLSDETIRHHHRLISAILGKAKKERIIPFNVASEHATPPKSRKKEAKYLDDVQARELVAILLAEEDVRKKKPPYYYACIAESAEENLAACSGGILIGRTI